MEHWSELGRTQLTFTCSNSTIETLGKKCEIYSKLTIKTPKRRRGRRSGVFIVNFEPISDLFLVFVLLILNKFNYAGKNTKGLFR